MDNRSDLADFPIEKYGVGQPVPRTEDPKLLRGEGTYTDDINLAGQVYGVVVRSRHAHGVLRGIDSTEAQGMPGVLGVYTSADLVAAGLGQMPAGGGAVNRDGSPMLKPAQTVLASDRVRYVGEPVAFVVGRTIDEAREAAEAVVVDVDSLPAVTDARAAVLPDAPQLYDDVPGNTILDFHFGDAGLVAAAFAKAAHVTRLRLINNRVVICAMEPRSTIVSHDAANDSWIIHTGSQGVFGLRNNLAKEVLGIAADKVRLQTHNVGGSFGMKGAVFPEYACLFHAARTLGRPVKWTDERSESFLSDTHGRDHDMDGELALDAEGRFLAVRLTGFGNLGAYPRQASPVPSTANAVKNVVGVYRTPLVEVSTRCVVTNTTPVAAYRGAGRPEGNFYMERLVDKAAREMGIDQIELRRRNHIPAEAMPYKAASEMTYDSGEFTRILDKALISSDWDGFAARKAESQKRGLLRGRGIGNYLEVTAPPGKEMGGIRFEPDGTVTIITGTLDYGQGHAAPFAQVLTARLGIPFGRIRLLQGDSAELIMGGGTGGSKSIMTSGAAIVKASDQVIEQGKRIAGAMLEAAVADIEFSQGRFVIAGTDRSLGIMEMADKIRAGFPLPADVPASLDVKLTIDGVPSAFPNGCHVAEVEVDPATGVTSVVKYSMVNDFGTLVNPMLVEGQAHGGIVQGIGQALMERTVYDADGQFLTGSFMDYALPRATDAPMFAFESHPVPATTNVLGAKGAGEAGCAGSLPAVMNALVDALSDYGITHIDMPATPQAIWRAIEKARKA